MQQKVEKKDLVVEAEVVRVCLRPLPTFIQFQTSSLSLTFTNTQTQGTYNVIIKGEITQIDNTITFAQMAAFTVEIEGNIGPPEFTTDLDNLAYLVGSKYTY